jgi:hypothetical protein
MMLMNFCSVLLATFTMLVLTHDVPYEQDWLLSGLVGLTMLIELGVALNELRQMVVLKFTAYITSMWNLLDLLSCASLLAAGLLHFLLLHDVIEQTSYGDTNDGSAASGEDPEYWVRMFGGIGVACKWAGMIDYLRLFPITAPHIRMIAVIANDVSPFLIILTISVLAASFSYSIQMPDNPVFSYSFEANPVFGPTMPFVTVLQASLGAFDIDDYTTPVSAFQFVVLTSFLMVLMMNMIIANMGDSFAKVKSNEQIAVLRPGPPGRLSTLSVFPCKSVFYGAFVWARRVLRS